MFSYRLKRKIPKIEQLAGNAFKEVEDSFDNEVEEILSVESATNSDYDDGFDRYKGISNRKETDLFYLWRNLLEE